MLNADANAGEGADTASKIGNVDFPANDTRVLAKLVTKSCPCGKMRR